MLLAECDFSGVELQTLLPRILAAIGSPKKAVRKAALEALEAIPEVCTISHQFENG